jgi:WD40 repeat protein/tetratricopeptide (TPR) repeat protein
MYHISAHCRAIRLPVFLLAVFLLLPLPEITGQAPDLVEALQVRTLEQDSMVSTGRFSRFGNFFALISRNNNVRMYDADFDLLWSYRGRGDHGTAPGIAISGDEARTIFPGYGSPSAIAVVDSGSGELIQRLTEHMEEVRALTISPDDRYLVSFAPGELFLWRYSAADASYHLTDTENPGDLRVSALSISPDSRFLALGNTSDYINLYSIDSENDALVPAGELRPNQYYGNTGYLDGLQFSPDGRWLATGVRKELTIYRVDDGLPELWQVIPEIEDGSIYSLVFAPDSRTLFTGFGASTIAVWRLNDEPDDRVQASAVGIGQQALERGDPAPMWEYQSTFSDGQGYMADLDVSPDGRSLASMSITENGLVLWTLEGIAPGRINSVASLIRRINGGFPPGSAQMSVLDYDLADRILARLGEGALAPRDMFETAAQYEIRLDGAARQAQEIIREAVRNRFGARLTGDGLLFGVQGQGSYDIDTELYYLPVAGSTARLSISAENALDLYLNWQDAEAFALDDGDAYRWSLIHPVSGRSYPLLFDADPLTGRRAANRSVAIGRLEVDERLILSDIEVEPVFPALYRSYPRQPLLRARLENKRDVPVENIRIVSRSSSDAEALELVSGVNLAAGQSLEIAAGAYFSPDILIDQGGDILPIILEISYRQGGGMLTRELRIPAERMNVNAIRWDDDRKVAAMVTTIQSSTVMESSGAILSSAEVVPAAGLPVNMRHAMALFAAMGESDLVYRVDPATPYEELSADAQAVDFLQFPVETLSYGSGDCDDLSVLYAALLEAAGVPTAFITIPGHIYLAYDTGIDESLAGRLFPDANQLILSSGRVWMPVETTLLNEGFIRAWETGAAQWRRHANRGEAELIITAEAWTVYPPAEFPDGPGRRALVPVASAELAASFESIRFSHADAFIENGGLGRADSRREYNRRGIIHARFGRYDEASDDFTAALVDGDYVPALVNLSKLAQIRGDAVAAADFLSRAERIQPDNPDVLLALSMRQLELGLVEQARQLYERVRSLDADLAARNPLFDPAGGGAGGRANEAERVRRLYLELEWSD